MGYVVKYILLHLLALCSSLEIQGPRFTTEPPHRLEFSNSTGGRLDCQGIGTPTPQVEWVESDGSIASSIPGLRRTLTNGSLEFPAFAGDRYRHDVHAAIYRCRLRSTHGQIVLSKEAHVRVVIHQSFEVKVYDEYVIAGNAAILKCQVPGYIADRIMITSWTQDNNLDIYPDNNIDGKYTILSNGDLYVSEATSEDAFKAYNCRVVNKLTGETHSSTYSGHVIVTEPKGSVQPRVTVDKQTVRRAALGDTIVVPCVSQAWPVPVYRWFREHHDQLTPIEPTNRIKIGGSGGGLLQINKLRLEDRGKYLCWVNNTVGDEAVQVTITVTAPLSVHMQPQSQEVDVGKEAVFHCVTSGHPVNKLWWLHDGKPLIQSSRVQVLSDPHRLHLRQAVKEDGGMYQCFIGNEWDQAQGGAELKLGDASPELIYWFSEQTLQPGPSLSLKCVATGSPPPQFTWTLDGFPIPETTRFLVGQYVTIHDDVISHVNISRVTEQDGGEYSCSARNAAGRTTHSARVNVYGLPYIREMPKITAVAGNDLTIKCPVAGYPIEAITWERDGQTLPLNRRQRVFPNGTLIVEQAQKVEDAGTYTCQATNRQRHAARRDVEVQIIVQPKILPIQPMTNLLREGMRAAISCQILEGDLPINFKWEKNGQQILISPYAASSSGIVTRRLDEYSTSLVIDHISSAHSGNYTCVASNVAGSERFTVPLTVNVPPRWTLEPTDLSASAGQDISLQCRADGYPQPSITWKKSIGNTPGEYKDFLFEPNVSVFGNGTLTFTRIGKESEGHYLCEARNDIGTGVSKVIFLKVNAPARFPSKTKTVQVTSGEAAHLQCAASGDAPIDITWRSPHHHTIAHHLDQRYSIREQVLDDGLVSELSILQTYRQDTGALTCIATNAYGQDEMVVHLVVQEVPETPKNIRIVDQQSRIIQISWTQPYAGNTPIIHYIVQYKPTSDVWLANPLKVIVPGSLTAATIQGLQPAFSYNIRIIAENKLGQSEPSQVIQITTLEEVPSGPPLNVRVEAKSSTEMMVSWEPPHRDHWNGNILGYYVGYQEISPNITEEENFLDGSTPTSLSQTPYTVKTVEAGPVAGGRIQTVLTGLEKFAAYSVIVQAYNSRGAGPASASANALTMEDVPSGSPVGVQCAAVGAGAVRVWWAAPEIRRTHGLLRGYRLIYKPVTELIDQEDQITKQITGRSTTLSGLRRYTNYSISVAAFTNAGDGVRSTPVYCHTEEDVPSAPADIKAFASSRSKIIVSWLPPLAPNGILVGYTFYVSTIEDGHEEGTHKRILSPTSLSHETTRGTATATHQYWVTASTRLGEGESTRVVTVQPSDKVPARIISFGGRSVCAWKENVSLWCNAVGEPSVRRRWLVRGRVIQTTPRRYIQSDGTLLITTTQASDSGNYTCTVENEDGNDEITYSLIVKVPPHPPVLAVVDAGPDTLHLQWSDREDGGAPIQGYVINYKREHGDWEELQVESGNHEHVLLNLWCGTRYQLYITAYNKIGTGLPCDIVNAYTKGTVPVKPKHSQMITVNATVVTVWLDSWGDGGCGILYFVIEYREVGQTQWRVSSPHVGGSERVWSARGLRPATAHQLRVTAHNHAGKAAALYNFTTHGDMSESEADLAADMEISIVDGWWRAALAAGMLLTLAAAVAALIVLLRKNKSSRSNSVTASVDTTSVPSKGNRDQHYMANRARMPAPIDSSTTSFKAEANEYMEDICPYATFQLTKPTYSESSYSGNVYSGPYHSVRGSFVYHDLKQDKYKQTHGKEPEYTKVRRKGNRLRDPHSESQESDNLGSTDSEVKKILSLHLPIAEYEDDASDDPSDCDQPTSTTAPPAPPRGDASSSSSETSCGGGVCGAGSGASGAARWRRGRRHVRSSSGYSSHNEETTFSISNYPSFNDHIHPPSRFSDDNDCEPNHHHRRKRTHSAQSDGKMTREAFQINV